MNPILLVPFLLRLSLDPTTDKNTYIIDATPLHTSCKNPHVEWHTSQGMLEIINPFRVELHPANPGPVEVWANIPDVPGCGGYIDFDVR